MRPLEKLKATNSGAGIRLVLPEGQDARIIEGARLTLNETEIELIVLDHGEALNALRASLSKEARARLHLFADTPLGKYRDLFLEIRGAKGASEADAQRAVQNPITLGALLVRSGDVHGMVAGAATSTAEVVRAGLQLIGKAEGSALVSSFFLMSPPASHSLENTFIFSDCGLNIAPNAEELAEIAYQSAQNYSQLVGEDPKLGFLSFSSFGSAKHSKVALVQEAVQIFKAKHPEIAADGEMQFDTAIAADVAKIKAPNSEVAGKANVLIFPDLNAGNIGYKIAQRLGGFEAIGPVLQGLSRPLNDLSRGCTAVDVLQMLALTALQVRG